MTHDATQFLSAIFADMPEGYIALTAVPGLQMGSVDQAFMHARNGFVHKPAGDTMEWNPDTGPDMDWYVVPALLSHEQRQKEDVIGSRVLWADFDFEVDLNDLNPQPSIVVRSSEDNRHCYWLLDQMVDRATLEDLNKRLAKQYGADESGWDAIQLLRLPAGVNSKRAEVYHPNLLWCHGDRRYSLDAFDHLPELSEFEVEEIESLASGDYPSLEFEREEVEMRLHQHITPELKKLLARRAPKGQRSTALYKCIAECERREIPAEDAFRIIFDSPADKWGEMRTRHQHAKELWRDIVRSYADIRSKRHAAQSSSDVLAKLKATRASQDLKGPDKAWEIGQTIVTDMEGRGLFLRTVQPERWYYLEQRTGRLFNIDPDDPRYRNLLLQWYKVFGAKEEFKDTHQLVFSRADQAEVHEIYDLSYYNRSTNTLYVNSFDNHMWKLDGKDIIRHKNGADGVVFQTRASMQPYKRESVDPGLLDRDIFAASKYDTAEGLTVDQYSMLYRAWTVSIFFRQMMPTRPLAFAVGPRGSGKTFLFKRLLRFLYGQRTSVHRMPETGEVLGRTASGRDIAIFDNADGKPSAEVEDMLAMAATGGDYTERKMYRNNEIEEVQLKAFVGITAQTPDVVSRSDLAQRLLVFPMQELGNDVIEENELFEHLDGHRNALWGEMLQYLNQVLAHVAVTGWNRPTAGLRMGDFARMLQVTAEVSNANVAPLLSHLSTTQRAIAVEGNPIVMALLDVLSFRDGTYLEQEHPTKEWYKLCSGAITDNSGPFVDAVKSPAQLGRQLRNVESMLQTLGYKMTRKDSSKGSLVRFDKVDPAG